MACYLGYNFTFTLNMVSQPLTLRYDSLGTEIFFRGSFSERLLSVPWFRYRHQYREIWNVVILAAWGLNNTKVLAQWYSARLRAGRLGVPVPSGAGSFSIHHRVQTGSGTQRVPGALSLGVKRPGREADHSPPSSAEVKNGWSYTFTSPIRLHSVVLG
jgi:hypothetical protein